jgi:hypothetical protein
MFGIINGNIGNFLNAFKGRYFILNIFLGFSSPVKRVKRRKGFDTGNIGLENIR